MSGPLLIIVTLINAGVSASELWRGHGPMAVVFAGYALANCGLIWQVLR